MKGSQSVTSIGSPVDVMWGAMRSAMHGCHWLPREENHPRGFIGVEGRTWYRSIL